MAEEGDRLSVVVFDDDESFLDEAKRAFDGEAATVRTFEEAQSHVESDVVDLLVLGPSHANEAALKIVGPLMDIDSGLPVVLVSEALTAPLLKSALRAGLKDVIEAPLSTEKAIEALALFERVGVKPGLVSPTAAPPPPRALGKVITVVSAKGGSGKTVVATNLAMLLNRELGPDRVVIVDADLQFGDVCLVLQLEPKYTVVSAAQEIHRLDESMLKTLLTRHESGLNVLAAPLEPAFADEISTRVITEIVAKLREMYDYVIVDTASLLDELLLSLLERADQALFVVDMDLPSVKNAKLALETLRLLKFQSSKIQLVLNRSNARARLDENEIERSLKMKISAAVPSDGLVPASVNEGRPVVESAPRSKVARGFETVASLVLDQKIESSKPGRRRWR